MFDVIDDMLYDDRTDAEKLSKVNAIADDDKTNSKQDQTVDYGLGQISCSKMRSDGQTNKHTFWTKIMTSISMNV